MSNCLNCGAPRGVTTGCRFCNAAYPTSSASDLARLDESTAWLKASSEEDPEMLGLAAMEIDDAIDAGRDAAAIDAHQKLVGCGAAISTQVIQARAKFRRS